MKKNLIKNPFIAFIFCLILAPLHPIWAEWIEFDHTVFDHQAFETEFFKGQPYDDDFFDIVAKQRAAETPNYNFSLDQFQDFYPGVKIDDLRENYGPGEIIVRQNDHLIYKFYISHIRYRFPIFVQTNPEKTIVDFIARLPNYFLHDVFHHSLIERIGRQDRYFKKNAHAFYHWSDVEGNSHTYTSTCTITCFPINYAVSTNRPQSPNFKSLSERLSTVKD